MKKILATLFLAVVVVLPATGTACAKREQPAASAGDEPGAVAPTAAADVWHICPMPEDNYWQKGPGRCPTCGMNLVPAPAGWTPPASAADCAAGSCATGEAAAPAPAAPNHAMTGIEGPAAAASAGPAQPSAGTPQSAVGTARELAPERLGQGATCPVTGETFTVVDETPAVSFEGKVYLFCCAACAPRFLADPQQFGAPPSGGG